MYSLDGSDVQTSGRLYRYQQLVLFIDLTGDDGFLLVAAGHRSRDGDRSLSGSYVELLLQSL